MPLVAVELPNFFFATTCSQIASNIKKFVVISLQPSIADNMDNYVASKSWY